MIVFMTSRNAARTLAMARRASQKPAKVVDCKDKPNVNGKRFGVDLKG